MHSSLDHCWRNLIHPLLEAAAARSIVEIGCAEGRNTLNLIEYCRKVGGTLDVIDPDPQFDVFEWRLQYADCLHLHEQTSLHALSALKHRIDAALIDGDHNWYTVYHELRLLEDLSKRSGFFPLTILHDVGWPYARRDMYSNPECIPLRDRHPFAKNGLLPWQSELELGLGMNANQRNAEHENGPRNGVLTAVEDFIAQSSHPLDWMMIPGFHGLGFLIDRTVVENNDNVKSFMRSLSLSLPIRNHLQALEDERVYISIENTHATRKAYELGRRLACAEEKLATRESLLNRANDCMDSLGSIRHSFEGKLASVTSQLHRMQQSNSWRITRFLRILEPKLKKLFFLRH